MVKLIIDIGNTRAKLAVFDAEECIELVSCSNHDLEGLEKLMQQYHPQKGILSSVVKLCPTVREQLQKTAIDILELNTNTPLPLKHPETIPPTMGADRIATIVEAVNQQPHQDLMVVDSGTCITYEFIDAEGRYMGGAISPGMDMRLQAMHQHTDLLPLVSAEGEAPLMSCDTRTEMRSGVIWGISHEIWGYASQLRTKKPNLLVFLTGGNIQNFDTNIKSGIFADSLLLLKGLNRILEYNEQ